jgi:hypothetical protein
MKILGGVLLALVLVSGCSSGSGNSPSAEKSKLPMVSIRTTCDTLFDYSGGTSGLWKDATDMVAARSTGDAWSPSNAKALAGKLDRVAEQARPQLRPHVQVMADNLRDLSHVDIAAYKASAQEVGNVCAPYAAG